MARKLNIEEIEKLLAKHNKGKQFPTTLENFVGSAERYIKASRHHAIICNIDTVSSSGMSRTLKFLQMDKSKEGRYSLLQFWDFFKALGFTEAKNSRGYFRVNGCGMDMVFATNYDIIHKLHRLGFITAKECDVLAQRTPTCV